MTFDDIWNQLCRKSPALSRRDSRLEFTSNNLKLLLKQVYEQGQKSVEPQVIQPKESKDDYLDAFRSMFRNM